MKLSWKTGDGADLLALKAPAKINLFLRITGLRGDGYHELESLIGFTELGDQVSASLASELELTISGPFGHALSAGVGDNLVLQAARALRDRYAGSRGAKLHLKKELPVSSGIGGGSANAAAALRLLVKLWGRGPDESGLMAMAADLGADVPVCLSSRVSRVRGAGEIVETMPPLPDCAIMLVNGGVPVSTRAIFQSGLNPRKANDWSFPNDVEELVSLIRHWGNDLQGPAVVMAPVIGQVLEAISATSHCLVAAMSGSGGTCFGIYPHRAAAAAAARKIEGENSGWWVRISRFRTLRPSVRTLRPSTD